MGGREGGNEGPRQPPLSPPPPPPQVAPQERGQGELDGSHGVWLPATSRAGVPEVLFQKSQTGLSCLLEKHLGGQRRPGCLETLRGPLGGRWLLEEKAAAASVSGLSVREDSLGETRALLIIFVNEPAARKLAHSGSLSGARGIPHRGVELRLGSPSFSLKGMEQRGVLYGRYLCCFQYRLPTLENSLRNRNIGVFCIVKRFNVLNAALTSFVRCYN